MCVHACVCVGGDVSNTVTLEYCMCCATVVFFPKGYAVSYWRYPIRSVLLLLLPQLIQT